MTIPSIEHSTIFNPAGCNSDLFPWVEVTIGAGSVPLNGPSLDDLADQFDFGRHPSDVPYHW